MIELQKRFKHYDRRVPVTVIDLSNANDVYSANEYILKIFSKEEFYDIWDNARNTSSYWIVIDEHSHTINFYKTFDEVLAEYCNFSIFGKNEKSTFPYWFAHWCAFQLTALNIRAWKPKYLLHDLEKPWLKLFMKYKKLQKWHREHNKHHLEYGLKHGFDKIDWEALMIDWECSKLSKKECPLNCREEMERKISSEKWKPYAKVIKTHLVPLLDSYML